MLAVFAAGSLVAGVVYGLVRLPGSLAARFVATTVGSALAGAAVDAWGAESAFAVPAGAAAAAALLALAGSRAVRVEPPMGG